MSKGTGKIVVDHGAVHYEKVATHEACKQCPTGCKTDCLRYNRDIVRLGTDDSLFAVDFNSFEFDMYDDYDSVFEG